MSVKEDSVRKEAESANSLRELSQLQKVGQRGAAGEGGRRSGDRVGDGGGEWGHKGEGTGGMVWSDMSYLHWDDCSQSSTIARVLPRRR